MSGIAQLFNVPGNKQELDTWSFCHAASHRDIIKAIYDQAGETLVEYSLDPLPIANLNTWTYQHAQMHEEMNRVLGVSSLNLTSVDFEDQYSRASWILANASEHRIASDLLRIGQPAISAVVTATLRSQAVSGVTSSSFSFAGLSFGPASGARYVVVCLSGFQASLANVTIGGIAATVVANVTNPSGGANRTAAIALANVPTGATGTVVVNFNSGSVGCAVAVYSLTGITAPAASVVVTSTANNPSASLTVSQNGAIIAVATTGALAPPSASWSNLTINTNDTYGPANQQNRTSASQNFTDTRIGLSVICSFTSSGQSAGCFVVFNPPTS